MNNAQKSIIRRSKQSHGEIIIQQIWTNFLEIIETQGETIFFNVVIQNHAKIDTCCLKWIVMYPGISKHKNQCAMNIQRESMLPFYK